MAREYKKHNIVIPDDIKDPKERKRYYHRAHYALHRSAYIKNAKKYNELHKERLKMYQQEWHKANKENKTINEIKLKKQEYMCLAKDFIEEIEQQGGKCDELQAFVLTHYYSEIFGSTWKSKYNDIEDELSYMYLRLKSTVEKGDITFAQNGQLLIGMKECVRCGLNLDVSEFGIDRKSKDGLRSSCRPCSNEYQREYMRQNPKKKQQYKDKAKQQRNAKKE